MAKKRKSRKNRLSCRFCMEEVTQYTTMEVCNACYAGLHYWGRKTPKQLIKRLDKLDTFQKRIQSLV